MNKSGTNALDNALDATHEIAAKLAGTIALLKGPRHEGDEDVVYARMLVNQALKALDDVSTSIDSAAIGISHLASGTAGSLSPGRKAGLTRVSLHDTVLP